MRAGQQRGYFHRVLSGRLCVHHTNLQQVIWHKAWTGSRQAAPLYGSHAPLRANSRPTRDSPHYLYIDANAQCPMPNAQGILCTNRAGQVCAADREGLQGAELEKLTQQ